MRPNDDMTRVPADARRGGNAPPFLWAGWQALPPVAYLALGLLLILLLLIAVVGPAAAGQATLNGLVGAGYFALGAVGLTLVYGVLRLVNFAHGDMLTFGTYVTLGVASQGVPFWPAAGLGMIATALLAVVLDRVIWEPMRRARTSTLQLFLVATGLAMVLRYSVQFFAGGQVRSVGLDTTSSVELGPWHLGSLQFLVLLVGLATILLAGLGLRYTRLGKEMRAVADNIALAEVAGIDTRRTIRLTWIVAGGLAALAGVLYAAAIGSINPNFGFTILLSLFAAAVLGGIGNAYGALAGGIVIGLAQEWSTLFFNPRWKPAVGFAILILTLLLMPRGIFGRRKARS
jgi:neutral amino acid transport system permease protein